MQFSIGCCRRRLVYLIRTFVMCVRAYTILSLHWPRNDDYTTAPSIPTSTNFVVINTVRFGHSYESHERHWHRHFCRRPYSMHSLQMLSHRKRLNSSQTFTATNSRMHPKLYVLLLAQSVWHIRLNANCACTAKQWQK